jgi:hypothetical protein
MSCKLSAGLNLFGGNIYIHKMENTPDIIQQFFRARISI